MKADRQRGSRLTVAVDIDGVVLDFVGAFIRTVEKHGHELSYEQVYCYDLSQVLGIPKELATKWIDETLAQNQFDVIEGAREALSILYREHTVLLITSQRRVHRERTLSVLRKSKIPFHVLGFVDFLKKYTVQPVPDVFIEDSVEEALVLAQFIEQVLLFDQPWNRGSLNVLGSFQRVQSWRQIMEKINELAPITSRRTVEAQPRHSG